MNMKTVWLLLGSAVLAPVAFADEPMDPNPSFAGAPNPYVTLPGTIPQGRHIDVGATADNKAGLAVLDHSQTGNTANNKMVSLDKMARMAGRLFVSKNIMHKDNKDVYVGRMYNMTGLYSWIPGMPDHSKLGRMSFAKVGNNDVWFGEWADVAAGAANGSAGTNRTVFYSGMGKTTNLPTSGTATYAVKGINNHVAHNTNVLQGTLTANFGTKRLNGTLSRSGLSIAINSAAINTAQASFNGPAKANGNINGNASGHFYGNQGAALAGIAKFNGHSHLDTAFGGTKQ